MVTIVIAWYSFLNYPLQTPIALEKQSILELEKRAVSETQRIPANKLDNELPRLPFGKWFRQVIGPEAGMVWRLTDCGEIRGATSNSIRDVRACVEANTILSNDRKVIVMIKVGTFKRGIVDAPAFYLGVMESEKELYTINRLRDLPKLLSQTMSLAPKLPTIDRLKVKLGTYNAQAAISAALRPDEIGQSITIEKPPPPPEARPKPEPAPSTAENQRAAGGVLQGEAIVKTQPKYPPDAKRFNVSGPVEVQVTISKTGKVTDAKAISGHPFLRVAAVDAARSWVFKPTTLNGVPVEMQLVLTFDFTIPK